MSICGDVGSSRNCVEMVSGWPSNATMLPKDSVLVIVSVPVKAVDARETGSETCFAICTGTGADVRLSEVVLFVEKRDLSIMLDGVSLGLAREVAVKKYSESSLSGARSEGDTRQAVGGDARHPRAHRFVGIWVELEVR